MEERKRIVISKSRTHEMVVYKTPVKGKKNRVGGQFYLSETKHELIPKKRRKSSQKEEIKTDS